jgi:hypothetical protein
MISLVFRLTTVATVLLSASAAHADEPLPLSLEWNFPAGAECPSGQQITDEIERSLASRNTRDWVPARAVAVVTSEAANNWKLTLKTEVGGSRGERTVQDVSCRAISDAAVVILSWMIDPTLALTPLSEPAAEQPEPHPVPPPSSPPPSRHAAHDVVGVSRAASVYAGIAGAADYGTLPELALGVHAHAGLITRSWRLGVHAGFWPQQREVIRHNAAGDAVGGEFRLLVAGAVACPLLTGAEATRAWSASVCAGFELDNVHGSGFGVSNPDRGSRTWLSFVAGVRADLEIAGPLYLSLGIDGVVPTLRERFALRNVALVHRPGAAAVRIVLGPELRF